MAPMAIYQRRDLETGEDIGLPGPLPEDLWGSLSDGDLEHLADLNPAAHYAGQGFFRVPDPEPEPVVRRLSRIAFLQRLGAPKRIQIRGAAKTDVVVEDFLDLLGATDLIELDNADTLAGVQYLVAHNLLTEADAEALLA